MRAVRFSHYGGREVLQVQELPTPAPGPGEVLVQVRAAGTNPGEAAIRSGAMEAVFPARFPSGQGSDLAGVVVAVGDGVSGWSPGDEVLGWSERRSSHATHVVVPAGQLVAKPAEMSWEVAGSLYVVGVTAWAAVRAVEAKTGETVAVSAAAGGVGSLVVQLLVDRGAHVIAIAGPANADWLRERGAVPVEYGDGLADRVRAAAPDGVDAFIDLFGPDYVRLAVELGVARDRIETIISFGLVDELGIKAEGNADASSADVLAQVVDLVAAGTLQVPIAATYPLAKVAEAFAQVEQRHTRGKVVLVP